LGKLSRKSDNRAGRSLCAGTMGKRCCVTATTVASKSTIMPQNVPCVPWCWEGKNYLFNGSDAGASRRGDLQPHQLRQAKRPKPRSLSAQRVGTYRRSSHQPHRRALALEPRQRTCSRLAPRWLVRPRQTLSRRPYNPRLLTTRSGRSEAEQKFQGRADAIRRVGEY